MSDQWYDLVCILDLARHKLADWTLSNLPTADLAWANHSLMSRIGRSAAM